MKKKIIAGIILAIGIYHLAWYGFSRVMVNKKLPDEKICREYQINLLKRMNVNIDLKSLEETYINSKGFKIHLDIISSGKDEPVLVFIPGTSVYAQSYIEFMHKMNRQGFTVIGFDPRGHGRSSGPRGDYTINEIVDDTLSVVKYARARFKGKVAVSGSSQGGIVAFYTAARDNSLAAAVCHNLADLNGRDNIVLSTVKFPQALSTYSEKVMNIYKSYVIPTTLYLDLTKVLLKDGSDAATLVKQDPLSVSWITFRAIASLLHTDLAKPVEEIRVPIMLIHSENDNIFPQDYVEGIFNRLTCKKKYLLFKNMEHLVLMNHVDDAIGPVAGWLKEVML